MTPKSCGLMVAFSVLAIFLLTPRDALAQAVSREYQIKAAFLTVLTDFVSWPGARRPGIDTPLKIGVVGGDPFQVTLEGGQKVNYLDLKLAEKNRQGKQFLVERYASADDCENCPVVLVSALSSAGSKEGTVQERLQAMKKRTAGQAVLLVSDVAGLAQRGAAVKLVVNEKTNRVQIEVSAQAANCDLLSISPQQLRLSTIVREINGRRGGRGIRLPDAVR